ncbi:hypothetical protein EZV62_000921 [Acer yangbiense]|uniref:C2H2-type domain-containing protein n=1 Tax=Acer yangbiense TaxID=1000413 RepID=A0A5C7IUY6_9ROSI|nr:hypothetical protein EZV62_000921 [Acer yangbiense]
MSGFGWTMKRDRNLNHYRKRPYPTPNIASLYPTPQIVCRFCPQVFMSTQALIHHIDTHIIENHVVSRRKHEKNLMLSQRDNNILDNPSPYQPKFPMALNPHRPEPLHEKIPFPISTTTPASQVFKSRMIPPQFWVKKFSQQMPEPPADRKHPFFAPKPPINVPADPVWPQVGRAIEDHNKETSDDIETLDLTLSL